MPRAMVRSEVTNDWAPTTAAATGYAADALRSGGAVGAPAAPFHDFIMPMRAFPPPPTAASMQESPMVASDVFMIAMRS